MLPYKPPSSHPATPATGVPLTPLKSLLLIVKPFINCKQKILVSISVNSTISTFTSSTRVITWWWDRFLFSTRTCLKIETPNSKVEWWGLSCNFFWNSYFTDSCFGLILWAAVGTVTVWHARVLAASQDHFWSGHQTCILPFQWMRVFSTNRVYQFSSPAVQFWEIRAFQKLWVLLMTSMAKSWNTQKTCTFKSFQGKVGGGGCLTRVRSAFPYNVCKMDLRAHNRSTNHDTLSLNSSLKANLFFGFPSGTLYHLNQSTVASR